MSGNCWLILEAEPSKREQYIFYFFHEYLWMSADSTTCRVDLLLFFIMMILNTGSGKPEAFDIRNINLYNIWSTNRRFRMKRISLTVTLFELCSRWHLESQLNVCLSKALRRRRWSHHMSSQLMTRLHQSCTGNPAFFCTFIIICCSCSHLYKSYSSNFLMRQSSKSWEALWISLHYIIWLN